LGWMGCGAQPEGMSAAERRKYGIEEIPVSEIRERASELGI